MRSVGSSSAVLGLFVALAIGSVGLKAAVGPPPDGTVDIRPGILEDELVDRLRSQGFSTSSLPKPNRSPIVLARRGVCVLSIRDARGGAAFHPIFTTDSRTIGPVRYLYRGQAFETVPTLAFRIGRLETEIFSRLGFNRSAPVPLALATTPGCGSSNFGLESVSIPS